MAITLADLVDDLDLLTDIRERWEREFPESDVCEDMYEILGEIVEQHPIVPSVRK